MRVNCLVCLGKLLEHLDKWLVLDEVLPFLPQIPSREPAVLMGILGMSYYGYSSHTEVVKKYAIKTYFYVSTNTVITKKLPVNKPKSLLN